MTRMNPNIGGVGSRVELLQWIRDLTRHDISKVEELGKGYAYCQVFDSIYGDCPLSKVKFDCNQEFQYIHNFKILQNHFVAHGIEKVPLEPPIFIYSFT